MNANASQSTEELQVDAETAPAKEGLTLEEIRQARAQIERAAKSWGGGVGGGGFGGGGLKASYHR